MAKLSFSCPGFKHRYFSASPVRKCAINWDFDPAALICRAVVCGLLAPGSRRGRFVLLERSKSGHFFADSFCEVTFTFASLWLSTRPKLC